LLLLLRRLLVRRLLVLHLQVPPIHLVGLVRSLGRQLDDFFRQKKLVIFAGL